MTCWPGELHPSPHRSSIPIDVGRTTPGVAFRTVDTRAGRAVAHQQGGDVAVTGPRLGGQGRHFGGRQARLSSAEMLAAASRRSGTARSPNASSTRDTGPETEIAVGVGAPGTAMEKQRTPISCSCSSIA